MRCWKADALVDPLPAGPVMLANLQLEILEPLFRRGDLPDTVIVSSLEAGPVAITWNVMRETLAVSRDVLNLFLIQDVVKNRSTN